MNDEALEVLYGLAQGDGYSKTFDEFKILMSQNEEAVNMMYGLAQGDGYKKDVDSFKTLVGFGADQKKKDESVVSESNLEEASLEPTSPTSQEIPAPSGGAASVDTELARTAALDAEVGQPFIVEGAPQQDLKPVFLPGNYGIQLVPDEDETYLTGSFGQMVNSIPYLGEFIDDSFRAMSKGKGRRESIVETHELMSKGSNFNMEDVESYVQSVKDYDAMVEQFGKSSDMKDFEAIYAEDPNMWGVVKGLAANPGVISEVFLESGSSMLNKASLEAFMAVEVGGTAGGALATGGVGAPAAAAASLPFAFAAAGAQLETAAMFTELLKEELGGQEFNEENVFALISNEKTYRRIVRKAKRKGATVGVIDAATGRVGAGIYTRLARQGKFYGGVAGTGLVEVTGAGFGEYASSKVIDREASAADIGLEATAGLTGVPVDIISAGRQQNIANINESRRRLDNILGKNPVGQDSPMYKINGEELELDMFMDILKDLEPQEFADTQIEVSNNEEVSQQVQSMFVNAQIESEISPDIQGEDRAKLVALETERQKYADSDLRSSKQRLNQIDARIKAIQDKYDVDPVIPEGSAVIPTFGDVLDSQATMQDGTKGYIRRDKEYGDRIVFESENQIIDLGNASELMDKPVSDLNITAEASKVTVTPDGEFVVDGEVYASQPDLPTLGIEYNADGSVKSVSVMGTDGAPKMFEGQVAEDLAYQILLENAQSESQIERVNSELESDEEFQRDHDQYVNRKQKELAGETQGATDTTTDEVSEEVSPEPTAEPEQAPDPLSPVTPVQPDQEPLTRDELKRRQQEDDLFEGDDVGITVPSILNNGIEGVKIGTFKKFREFVRRRMFSSRAFRTMSLRRLMEKQEASMSYYNNLIDRTIRRFDKAFKKATKGMSPEDVAAMNEAFDARLRGDMTQALPAELEIMAAEMRALIDAESQALLDMGGIPVSTAESIEQNLGTYMRRSYRMFDDPNYKPSEAVVQRARDTVREQVRSAAENLSARTGEDVDAIIERMVDTKLNDILAQGQQSSAFKKGSRFGSKDVSSLKARKDFDPAIAEYMGLYTDPTLNWARTMQVLGGMTSNTKFLNDVYEQGTRNGWMFEASDPNRDSRFSYKMAGENTETLSPLGNMYTTPEIGNVLENAQKQYGMWARAYRSSVAAAKWTKTIASPVTHMVNLFGNVGFAWSNGHFDMSGPSPFKVLGANIDLITDQQLTDYFDVMVKRGVINQSPSLSEVRALFKDGNVEALLESRASDSNITKRQKVANGIAKGKSGMEAIYQMEDDIWKIFGFNNETSRYANALYGKTVDQLTDSELDRVYDIAAENVKNTYANYSRAPETIQALRGLPIGNFVTFQAEAYRTQYNIFALGVKEIKEGKRTNNPELTKIGQKRIAGSLSYNLTRRSIVEGSAIMAGVGLTGTLRGLNDEDKTQRQEDIRMFLPFWSENSDVLYLSIDPGKVEYIDFNASDPFGNTGRIINAFMNEEDMDKALINSLAESIGPFAEPEMVANTVNNLYNKKKNSGAPLYPDGATDSQKADAIIKEFYDLYKPGLFSSIKTMRQSESKVRDGLLMMVGMRPYTVDIEKTFRYKTYDLAKKIRSAEKNENIDLYNESIKEMSDLYMAAVRLGVPSEDLVKDMRAISKDNKYKIRTGKF